MRVTNLKIFTCCLLFLTAAACVSRNNEVILEGRLDLPQEIACELFLKQRDSLITIHPDSIRNTFTVRMACDTPYFATLVAVIGAGEEQWPFSQPLFVDPGKTILIVLKPQNRQMQVTFDDKDKNNNALNAFQQFYLDHNRELWTTPPADSLAKEFLEAYCRKANAVIEGYHPSEPVGKYLTIYSYLAYMAGIDNLEFMHRRDTGYKLPENIKDVLPASKKILDHPIALNFPSTIGIITENLPGSATTPEEKIRLLQQAYTQPEIIRQTTLEILQHYVSAYDYTRNFDEGLARLEKMCALLPDGDDRLIQEFAAKKYSVEGASLPAATLEDKDGKTYKLSDFKGKYLYIDLWASWCVPCCAEVPHLQKLEKQIKNKEVQFISISIDKNRKDWLGRMEQLHLKGNQFIAVGDELSAMLNIQGIPHFLIYGKDGKLMKYEAPPPSSGKPLQDMLENFR